MTVKMLIVRAQNGFATLNINQKYVKTALGFLEDWLTKEKFKNYFPQVEQLILNQHWNYLLDSFYQIIPFGTGGRRGEVGVGPNRINPWTIQASAQGHSQYLIKKYGNEAKKRGVVFAYDNREFFGNRFLDNNLENPVKNLTSKNLAITAAEVYTANRIRVYLFDDIRTTPELSFTIRHLGAVAGDMFSASHNPPDHNGKKVYDEFGGQLIPPEDEELVTEVTKKVTKIKKMSYQQAISEGLIKKISSRVDEEYLKAATGVSLSSERNLKIAFTPLHGCGSTSVYKGLKKLGFEIFEDPKTNNPSGKFENITFNIPNPEVIQSFDTTLKFAKKEGVDIVLNSDPDADRIGIMVRHHNNWIFLNGNEIAAILTEYVIQKRKEKIKKSGVVIKTTVTTNLIEKICQKNNVEVIGELLIGFKYIANAMNLLEEKGRMAEFLVGCEESHGYLAGNYARDKDAITAAVWLSELSAELKKQNKTLIDYLNQIYSKYGYFKNYLTEIRLLGAVGKEKIDQIQSSLRKNCPDRFGKYRVERVEDCLSRKPILSETDKTAKDVLIFHLKPLAKTTSIKVTIRPSGTEPKIKMYFEIGTGPVVFDQLAMVKKDIEDILQDLEQAIMLACYQIIDIDFPKRGFLLFWQLPLDDKMTYFKIEPEIEKLKNIKSKINRKKKFLKLVSFLGSNPVEKMDQAFKAKNGVSVLAYLELKENSKIPNQKN
ncbi:MAG: phospho-sugar mutase [Candidatus Shapirobacteria bacterium]|nr:phospho-sugar mutase [Candidatus Shapirobacteria bacterium]